MEVPDVRTWDPTDSDLEQSEWLQTTTIPKYGGYHDPRLPDTQPTWIYEAGSKNRGVWLSSETLHGNPSREHLCRVGEDSGSFLL